MLCLFLEWNGKTIEETSVDKKRVEDNFTQWQSRAFDSEKFIDLSIPSQMLVV